MREFKLSPSSCTIRNSGMYQDRASQVMLPPILTM